MQLNILRMHMVMSACVFIHAGMLRVCVVLIIASSPPHGLEVVTKRADVGVMKVDKMFFQRICLSLSRYTWALDLIYQYIKTYTAYMKPHWNHHDINRLNACSKVCGALSFSGKFDGTWQSAHVSLWHQVFCKMQYYVLQHGVYSHMYSVLSNTLTPDCIALEEPSRTAQQIVFLQSSCVLQHAADVCLGCSSSPIQDHRGFVLHTNLRPTTSELQCMVRYEDT